MNILKAAAIPAILTLLISGIGWLLDRSVQRFENVLFLRYSTEVERLGGKTLFWIEVENQSAAAAIANIDVAVKCPQQKACLREKTGGTETNKYVSYDGVPPLSVPWQPNGDSQNFASEFSIQALQIGAVARFVYEIASSADQPSVWFQFPELATGTISVFNDYSPEAWVASHSSAVLFGAIVVLGLVIVLYAIWLGSSETKGGSDDRRVQVHRLVHSVEPHVSPNPPDPRG